jgi:GTP-binding protein
MLRDKVRVKLISGKGGDGAVDFGRNRKPNGGDGGNGGSIYIEGTTSLYDLGSFNKDIEYKAGDGLKGGSERKQGRYGEDLVLKVPLVTVLRDSSGKELVRVDKPGERILIAKGGRGGLGNFNFRSGQVATLYKFYPGDKGQTIEGELDLQLQADVVLIGLPNAGKSTLLNSLTNAKAKVAPYPFTTTEPHLGVAGNLVLMDLPGIIEGAAEGKGLGDWFMKHAETAKLVLHLISVENENVAAAYKTIRAELEELSTDLAARPEIVLLTKSDMVTPEALKQTEKVLKKVAGKVFTLSSFDEDKLVELSKLLADAALGKNPS